MNTREPIGVKKCLNCKVNFAYHLEREKYCSHSCCNEFYKKKRKKETRGGLEMKEAKHECIGYNPYCKKCKKEHKELLKKIGIIEEVKRVKVEK